jgi:hypothetical protein
MKKYLVGLCKKRFEVMKISLVYREVDIDDASLQGLSELEKWDWDAMISAVLKAVDYGDVSSLHLNPYDIMEMRQDQMQSGKGDVDFSQNGITTNTFIGRVRIVPDSNVKIGAITAYIN